MGGKDEVGGAGGRFEMSDGFEGGECGRDAGSRGYFATVFRRKMRLKCV